MSKHVLIQKTGTTVTVASANPSLLADGTLAIYNGDTGAVLAANYTTTGSIPFFIAQGAVSPKNPRLSPVIKASSVSSIVKKRYAQTVPPVYNVGYSGSGSLNINFLAASGSTTVPYGIKIENLINNVPPFPKAYAQYTLTAAKGTANQNPVYVCDQLAKDLNQQLSVMPTVDGGQFAKVDVLTDLATATVVASGTSVTYAITNNSPVITITDTVALTNNAVLAAGNWIRIGANATTNPIYQILSVVVTSGTVTTVTLTRPFVGTSATATAIASLTGTASLPSSSNLAGFKISVQGNYFNTNAYASGKPNMNVNIPLQDTLAGTPITLATAGVYGSGTVDYVTKDEMSALGNIGVENRIWLPLPNDLYAAAYNNAGYMAYTFNYNNAVSDKSAQGENRSEPGTLTVYIDDAATITNWEAAILAVTGLAALS